VKKNPDAEIDGELLDLIEKWRAASQQAAEELFGKVRDRVNKWVISSIWSEDTQLIR